MPFLAVKKSPADRLRETKAILSRWIKETQEALAVPAVPGLDELWRLDYADSIIAWTAQTKLIDELLMHPEQRTAHGLEALLRARFHRDDELHAAIAELPRFDELDDELNDASMDESERTARHQVTLLHDEQYQIDRQCDLIAQFLGISERRIHDVHHIILAHHEDEETRKLTKKEEAATYYPIIKAWMNGTGMLKSLPIPTHFSSWMTEYPSPFPTLI
jgi:hypothetical protein